MFEKTGLHCPRCGFEISEKLTDGGEFVCSACRSRFEILLDDNTGKVGFYESAGKEIPEPLYLPKGSIRALTAMAVTGACWMMIFTQKEVPGAIFSLILTVIGYYFGFRAKSKAAGSRIFDPSVRKVAPLFLPGGFIRAVLVVGFLAAGVFLLVRGKLSEPAYLEFFVILFGLIAGHIFGRILAQAGTGRWCLLINHAKGAAVLVVSAWLAWLLVSGKHSALPGPTLAALCAFVSFYFGSRS